MCLYGDPAYPLGVHLQGPYKIRYKAMSEVRVSVEWLSGNITNHFKFVNFEKQMKINLSAVGKMYVVCALVSRKFELQPPSLREYFC